jgi:hypothetical protein
MTTEKKTVNPDCILSYRHLQKSRIFPGLNRHGESHPPASEQAMAAGR